MFRCPSCFEADLDPESPAGSGDADIMFCHRCGNLSQLKRPGVWVMADAELLSDLTRAQMARYVALMAERDNRISHQLRLDPEPFCKQYETL